MIIERGLNDHWVRSRDVFSSEDGSLLLRLQETLGKAWASELVTWELPLSGDEVPVEVTCEGCAVPFQVTGKVLAARVEDLQPHECRELRVTIGPESQSQVDAEGEDASEVRMEATANGVVFGNHQVEFLLPATQTGCGDDGSPGPIVSVRRHGGEWLGRGCLQGTPPRLAIETKMVESGALWSTVEALYRFEGGREYRVRLRLAPDDDFCEVTEESTLPVQLWPAPRPYREIGTLGSSHWVQNLDDVAKPCVRPCPSSNFIFDPRPGWAPDYLVTHSTSAWEIMNLPLGADSIKTYTAMRPTTPSIDGGWLGVYASGGDLLLGVASLDVNHWKIPDETLHPAHRMPGASAEVLLIDSPEDGTHLRFPVQNIRRRWLLALTTCSNQATDHDGQPFKDEPDPSHPLWAQRMRRGDLALDKVRHWVVDWPDAEHDHPRLLCRESDFPEIRRKVERVPELRANREATLHLHAADRYLLTGEAPGLAAIEEATHAGELVRGILTQGLTGPTYAIGLARPLRRYALSCDVVWESLTPEEKREARRVCALAAYILTDGDWWQFAFQEGQTNYLPNFNTDVFTCAGIIGLFLSDHPCSQLWTGYLVDRLDLEIEQHLRLDGGGEENVGAYLPASWKQLYLPALWSLRHCAVRDFSGDPRILGGARFLLKALGPPDPRDEGRRMLPPIGHHPGARKGLPFAPWIAAFVKDHDPGLAANLHWAWRATGARVLRNTDHSGPEAYPLTPHYVCHDATIPEVAPDLGSYDFPHVGAVLRSHGLSDKGSYLFLKAGRVHSHHDDDEGSFHYCGRGVPLAADGLPLDNGATAEQHNAVTFARKGQPSGRVEAFATTAGADYVRAIIGPRAFACDAMFIDETHRSGFTRELVLVKPEAPGGVEYVVVKDTVTGPDPCQWNLDVLSRRPFVRAPGNLWFPGHEGFGIGLEVLWVEPAAPEIQFEEGKVNPDLLTPETRQKVPAHYVDWACHEHWLMHVPGEPGTTFLAVLFPRRPDESGPEVTFLDREETLAIEHAEGRDLLFLRPNPGVGVSLDGIRFRGRSGLVRYRESTRVLLPLDAIEMTDAEAKAPPCL